MEQVFKSTCSSLLNELLADAEEELEKGSAFHYSWLLILILFVAWAELENYQGVDVPILCRGARYQNLWLKKDLMQRLKDNNVEFFLQAEALQYHVRSRSKLPCNMLSSLETLSDFRS